MFERISLRTRWVVPAAIFVALIALRPAAAAPKKAPCAVCSVREGAGPEEVAATVEYRGKTYSFCQPACKDEFLQDAEKWIRAAQAAKPEPHKHEGGSAAPS